MLRGVLTAARLPGDEESHCEGVLPVALRWPSALIQQLTLKHLAQRDRHLKYSRDAANATPPPPTTTIEQAIIAFFTGLKASPLTHALTGFEPTRDAVIQQILFRRLALTRWNEAITPEVNTEPVKGHATGYVGHFIGGEIGWAIAWLFNADGTTLAHHLKRFESGDKYKSLTVKDWRVVDVAAADSAADSAVASEDDPVKSHPRLMRVRLSELQPAVRGDLARPHGRHRSA